MCDSLEIYIGVEHVVSPGLEASPFPFVFDRKINQDGEVVSSKGLMINAVSPLTGAGFKVKSVFKNKEVLPSELIGYELSINTPACTIGNNALPQNLVYSSALLAIEQLKHHALVNGACPNAVAQISISNALLKSVTLTFLIRYDSYDLAVNANEQLHEHAVTILNANVDIPKAKQPAYAVGSPGNKTVYINKPPKFKIKSYVKSGPTPKSKELFKPEQVARELYAESSHFLRLEIDLYFDWLEANKLQLPDNWKGREASLPACRFAFQEIRSVLRLDDKFRQRQPKATDMNDLSSTEASIVNWHLTGEHFKTHKDLVGKSAQYISQIKRKVEETLNIDMSIPWDDQSTKLVSDLKRQLIWSKQYQSPLNLGPHCFTVETAKAQLKILRKKSSALVTIKNARVPIPYSSNITIFQAPKPTVALKKATHSDTAIRQEIIRPTKVKRTLKRKA